MKKKKEFVFKPKEKVEVITSAAVRDGFCNYSYKVTEGVGEGDTHAVKGSGIVMETLSDAFTGLNVHLACIDDVFKHNKIDIKNIGKMINNELTALYNVTGFAITGTEEQESVVLSGSKKITCSGGWIDLKTPRIPMDDLSSYRFCNELREAVEAARIEVESYKAGNCTPVDDTPKENPKQLKITADESEELIED
jgi:hypothetical protein